MYPTLSVVVTNLLINFEFFFFHAIDHTSVMSSVLIAAKKLSILLQQNGNMSHQPDAFTANILNTWLQQHSLPVCSIFVHIKCYERFVWNYG